MFLLFKCDMMDIGKRGIVMIKEATYQDKDDIFTLMNELENNTLSKKMFDQQYEACMKNEHFYLYIYKDRDIKGCISLYLQNYLHHQRQTGEIGELIVKKEYRNQQIGKKLLQFVENKGKELQLEEISLSSHMKRADAHRFYERHGYIKDHYSFEKKL